MIKVHINVQPVGVLTAQYSIIVTKPIDTCSSSI